MLLYRSHCSWQWDGEEEKEKNNYRRRADRSLFQHHHTHCHHHHHHHHHHHQYDHGTGYTKEAEAQQSSQQANQGQGESSESRRAGSWRGKLDEDFLRGCDKEENSALTQPPPPPPLPPTTQTEIRINKCEKYVGDGLSEVDEIKHERRRRASSFMTTGYNSDMKRNSRFSIFPPPFSNFLNKTFSSSTSPPSRSLLFIFCTIIIMTGRPCLGNPDAKRLYDDLLSNYNRLIRPVSNNTDTVLVRLGLRLSQLIDLNLKDQILTTNVWLEHEWEDHKFQWDPKEYGGVTELYVPSEHIWLPDIVLYNNADGDYVVTTMTKAVLHSNGKVRWTPPAIFKSSCEIDVRYFPFDMQTCFMKFGSWSYDGYQIDLKHMNEIPGENHVPVGTDLEDYYPSVEWDIISVPAERHEVFYPCCKEPYLDIYFNITLRRRTLFYTVNLIVPTVGISYLSILVFYLPADSGEKIALCISILLSQTMFFLLISEIIPSTSLAVPLLGKYLLFTMFLVGLSVLVTTIVLNVHYRKPSTHKMAPWVRHFFTRILPKFLLMRVPEHVLNYNAEHSVTTTTMSPNNSREDGCNGFQGVSRLSGLSLQGFSGFLEQGALEGFPGTPSTSYGLNGPEPDNLRKRFPFEIQKAIHNVEFIQTHMVRQDAFDAEDHDWGFVAMVLDRMFLWLFNFAFFLGTIMILLEAPALYDYSEAIDKKISRIVKFLPDPET